MLLRSVPLIAMAPLIILIFGRDVATVAAGDGIRLGDPDRLLAGAVLPGLVGGRGGDPAVSLVLYNVVQIVETVVLARMGMKVDQGG